MKVLFKNKEILAIWQGLFEDAREEETLRHPDDPGAGKGDSLLSSAKEGAGTCYANKYVTGSKLGVYTFTEEGCVFEGRRNSFLMGSECVIPEPQGITIINPFGLEVTLAGSWELLESQTPERDPFTVVKPLPVPASASLSNSVIPLRWDIPERVYLRKS